MFNNRECRRAIVLVLVGSASLASPLAAYSDGFREGDTIVTVSRAPLMRGDMTLGYVPAQTRLLIHKVNGDWLGVKAVIDGHDIAAWIHAKHVASAAVLAEPQPDRGLIIGRVNLRFDGYKGRTGRYTQPLTLHCEVESAEPQERPTVVKTNTDSNGYYALTNVHLKATYRIAKIESGALSLPSVSDRYSLKAFADSAVYDKGVLVVTVSRDGSIVFTFDDGPLDRHNWFEKTYAGSSWADIVQKDRIRLEGEK